MTFGQVIEHLGANGKGMAKCPAHPDTTASLSVGRGDDGRTLLKCFTGCATEAVVTAAGLTMADLFPDGGRGGVIPFRQHRTGATPDGCTLAAYATAKRLPLDELRAWGLSEIRYMGAPAVRITYRNIDGTEAAIRFRTALEKTAEGDQRFTWRRGSKVMPYGLERIGQGREAGYIAVVEGESDCHVCWMHGIPAVGLPGANTWRNEWAAYFDGIGTIYVVIEPDQGGATVLDKLSRSPLRDRIKLVRLVGHKDVADLHVESSDTFLAVWTEAIGAAESVVALVDAETRARADVAWRRCQSLAAQPDILAALDDSLARRGVVGEQRAARLIYLATTSRFSPRPTSIAVKGPSSGGKSFVTEQVLQHFPASAYYALSGMSERALAYSEEPLEHRMLVLYEAQGMSSDFATYLIRSLLSEGRIRYEVVEKTKDGLRPRLIEREGPTGLITTTTAVHLHPENETRLLSIPVTDTRDQTRLILLAQSQDRVTDDAEDLEQWHALQDWLAGAEHRVSIPFARRLAEQIPAVAVRQRRDFATLLSLVKAHAVLHQVTRDRDADGRVVATVEDYGAVRALVADLFEVAVQATVSDTTRETVAAVGKLVRTTPAGVSIGSVAAVLHVDKSTASRRVAVAVEDGYLENRQTDKGKPAKLVIGDPLPDQSSLLPDPASLTDRCSVAVLPEGTDIPPPPSGLSARSRGGADAGVRY